MLTCPSCGRDNPEDFQFCGFCTAPLSQAPRPAAEERKVVSVLFCDLVGFTASSDQADPEDVRATLRPYHERVRREIERAGGTVEKFIGDAVMAVFGAPVAHEDDAERAVLAALKVLDAIPELNETHPQGRLAVRIGINTGEAVVALGARPETGEGIVTGDVVNTAARLEQSAPVGEAVVGEVTYRITKDVFAYEALEPVEAKGKAAPIPIWRAIARKRLGIEAELQAPTPFIGRDDDLALLEQTFHRTLRERSLQLVTITGEPGVGKSRLVAEFRKYVDDLPDIYHWRQGRCLPYGEGITFWALGEIVKAQAGILESDAPDVAASKLDRVIPESKDREWLRQRLLPLIGLEASSTGEREELFTAWRRFLESLAEQRPSVFVFEDLHWADDSLLDFLEHLADWSEGVPMLLAAMARPELYERRPGWAGGKRNATAINLSPLSEAETARLISALLEAAVLPAEVQALILERAGGNPLYAEEFVRLLKDRGLLVRKGGTYALAETAEIPFPEGIQALIAARLDTLSSERKAMLQDAAVIGKVFWAGAVAEMGELEPREVSEALHELSRKELVRPARASSMEGEAEYSFWHIFVRDVAYSQIPRLQRVERHKRAAAWIEGVAGERVEDHSEILVHHYTNALDLARASGQTDEVEDLEASALRFLVLAAERALGLDAAKAEVSLAKALDLTPPGHPRRPEVLARWADAVRHVGRTLECAEALREAIEAFRERGDIPGAARAMTKLANVMWALGDPAATRVVAEVVALLEAEPPGPDLVAAYAEAARLEGLRGESEKGVEWAERAMALAGDLGLEEPAKALGYRGMSRCWLGDAGGLEDIRRALALAIDRGLGWEAGILYNNLAVLVGPVEGPAASLEIFREGIEFCERRAILGIALHSEVLNELFWLGLWDEVLQAAARLAEQMQAAGDVVALADIRCNQVRILSLRGKAQEAVPLSEWAIESERESAALERVVMAFSAGAVCRLAVGDLEGSADLLRTLEVMPYVRSTPVYGPFLPEMVRTAIAASDLGLAERLATGVEPTYPFQEHALYVVGAALTEAKGQPEEAAALYSEAAERWKGFGVLPEQAFALVGLGRCLLVLERMDAPDALRRAREIFQRLGAKPALAETDALLGRATALTS